MKFTIIVPVYNVEKYLDTCVNSILNQSFTDYELILVDDGSKDKSSEICDKYEKLDKRIKVIHKINGGLVSARKEGAKIASGDYIINIDSDDFIVSNYLQTIYNELENNNYPDMMAIGYRRVNDSGELIGNDITNILPKKLYKDNELNYVRDNYLYSKEIRGSNYGIIIFSVCTKIVKRNIYIKNQLIVPDNIKYGEDLILTFLMLKDINTLYVSNYAGYMYRTSQISMMGKLGLNSLAGYEVTIRCLCAFFPGEENKFYVYAENSLVNCLASMVINSKSFKEYRILFKESYKYTLIWDFAHKAKYNKTFKDYIKGILIKFRLSFLIYIWFKNR